MNRTDEHIKNMLQEKFASHESPVDPKIWNSISNSMASATAPAAASLSIVKIIGIAAAVVLAVVSTYLISTSEDQSTAIEPIAHQNEVATKDTESLKIDSTSKSTPSASSNTPEFITSPNPYWGSVEAEELNQEISSNSESSKTEIQTGGIPDAVPAKTDAFSDKNTSVAEPLSAAFHTKQVDASTLRYFFFPKTSEGVTFKWTSSDGFTSTDITFSHQFSDEGNYSIELTVTDKQGNSTTESSTVHAVRPIQFKIPNAFSPGINGRNDVINFEEAIIDESSILSVVIQDRAGTVIYDSKNSLIWDGTNIAGELTPNGTYTYIIMAIDKLGETKMNKGTIQLFHE